MDIHYNAFISYRHHPDDIRVASQIHRLLEHYRIPRALRKQSKRITRLFRDKEELPITSNLTDDITRALQNSDYLIVICSTHTRESTWVRREIETFLKTHDRSKVLTVLADGEPYDTIPEILLREERVNPRTGETELVDIEPLSCDWRLPLRQAKREELPRLAAALMGCGYDELRRRERQYRVRRLVAGCSAALAAMACITGYVLYNSMLIRNANEQLEQANTNLNNANISLENANAEILANYNEALINQSQYLASSAEKLLEEGDRMTAMALALEALPGYGGERPYVAEAEYALAQAVGLYERGTTMKAAGVFACDEIVSDFRLSGDGKVLYTLDARNMLTVWDTATFRKLGSTVLSLDAEEMLITEAGDLLIMDQYAALECYGRDGKRLWSLTGDLVDVAFLDNRETVLVELTESAQTKVFQTLNARTGEAAAEPVRCGSEKNLYFLREVYPSSVPLMMYSLKFPNSWLHMVNLTDGSLTPLGDVCAYIHRACVTEDGNLVAMVQKEELSSLRGQYMNMTVTAPETLVVQCFRGTDGKLLWETEIPTYVYGVCVTLETIPNVGDILFQHGNVFAVLDPASGEIKAANETVSCVMWTKVGQTNTWAILENGSMGTFRYDDSHCGFIPSTKDELIHAEAWESDVYVTEYLGTQVVCYRYLGDSNWVSYGEEGDVYVDEWHTFGDYMVMEAYDALQLMDTASGSILWTISLRSPEILCVSHDETALWVCTESGRILLRIDVATGETEQWELPNDVEDISVYSGKLETIPTGPLGREVACVDGVVYYLTQYYSAEKTYLFRYDTVSETGEYWDLYTWDSSYSGFNCGRLVAVADGFVLVWNQTDNTLLEFSLTAGTSRVIAENVVGLPAYLAREDGTYFLGCSGSVQHRAWGQNVLQTFCLPECRAVSVHMFDEYLLTLGDDGFVYRFDTDGSLLSKTLINRYNTFSSHITATDFDPSAITWERTNDGDLMLGADNAGTLIDCGSWKMRAWIPDYYTYLPDSNSVLMRDAVNYYGRGCYPLYSLEDVVAMAEEALNGYELSESLREAYGLD